MPTAYSYLRFSSPQQSTGDSIRRQTAARDKWLADHPDVTLDNSLKLHDLGRSAFKRRDWATYALAQFVEHVNAGRVPAGSYLLVENLDRLSRESAGEATQLFLTIVNKGVAIVQLSPAAMEFRKPVDMMALMYAIMELSRGHAESQLKSERVGAAWRKKQQGAAEKVVTRKLPGWVKEEGGRLSLDPAKAETVRRIFALAIDGHGARGIAQLLNGEGVPVLGRVAVKGKAVAWASSTVYHLLRSRATIGEYRPYQGARGADPVAGYYPAVVDEGTFARAQAAITRRAAVGRGRRSKHVNLFAGLLRTPAGDTLTYWHRNGQPTVLVPTGPKDGRGGKWESFPAGVFERGVLEQLAEVSAAEIAGGGPEPSRAEVLAGRLAEVDALVGQWRAQMDNPAIVAIVAQKLTELSAERTAVVAELDGLRREAASPLSESWGEFRSLAGVLKDDSGDQTRLKVQAALRRAVAAVYVLVVTFARTHKVAAVQVRFTAGGPDRFYVLTYQHGKPAVAGSRLMAGPNSLTDAAGAALCEQMIRERVGPVLKAGR